MVQAANTRVIRLQGYAPTQLLLGYLPKYADMPWATGDEIRREVLGDEIAAVGLDSSAREAQQYHSRLANLDEIRERAIATKLQKAKATRTASARTRLSPVEGDLVLLRRLALANQKGRKLEPR